MDEEEAEPMTTVFGVSVPDIGDDIQPLECLILIKGINMENGMPTMTTIGSEGITPWEAMGMMAMETERIKMMAFMQVYTSDDDEEE